MSRMRSERGQVFVMTVISMTVLLGMAAFVLDVGAWFHSKRHLQATADAAALAGAQALPDDPTTATQWAVDYANKNGGGVAAADVTITSTNQSTDTIAVTGKKTEPGFFSRVLGIDAVDVRAAAKAIVGPPAQALYVAPMVVNCNHPLIKNCNGKGSPKFTVPTTLDFDPLGAPGAFGMLNLDGGNGTPGSSDEAAWILKGFNKYLGLGFYNSDPGAKFDSQQVDGALDQRIGTELLFPVYRTLTGQGQNAQYDIIGWIGFHLTSYQASGTNATLQGYFTRFIAQGILASKNGASSGAPGTFGVKTIQLIG
jgi:putative Flp pilus-assembly TadE/G-like protein